MHDSQHVQCVFVAVFMLRDSFFYVNKADSLHIHTYTSIYIVYVQLLMMAACGAHVFFFINYVFLVSIRKNTLCAARTPQITDIRIINHRSCWMRMKLSFFFMHGVM